MLTTRIPNLLEICVTAIVILSATTTAFAEESKVDFTNDLLPLFTKHGCNAGACHGAAIGRGGFKLSLYAGNPTSDYEAIVREIGGRRVNLSKPDRSLIVLKPTLEVDHGGEDIFDFGSQSAQLLIRWVQEGATFDSPRRLDRVDISPHRQVANQTGDPIKLQAIAHYSDGTHRDVTAWTVFAAEDDSAVEITQQSGGTSVATVQRRGRHIVIARYLTEVVPIQLIVPLADHPVDLANEPRKNFIDEQTLATLSTLRLTPSPQIDDATFLRRVTLDLTGRLPSEQAAATASQLERAKLIDDLIDSEEFTEYWTLQFANCCEFGRNAKTRTALRFITAGLPSRCAKTSAMTN